MQISKESISFLKELAKNNNRDWFNERKETFLGHQQEAKNFFAAVEENLSESDKIESHKVFRIYRDVRFSKDKSPFKNRFAGGFKRATVHLRGGYYLNIEPGNSGVGGGFYAPNKEDLFRFRKEIEIDDSEIRKILNNKKFKATFGELQGNELKTAPRGFSPELKGIDIIRKKNFYVFKNFTDKEVTSPNFINEVKDVFKTIRPYFDYMSDVLTTDLNGESIV